MSRVCKKCGASVPEGYAFCSKCGEPYVEDNEVIAEADSGVVENVIVKKTCNSCGNTLDEDQMFCPKCGSKYGENSLPSSDGKKKSRVKMAILIPAIIVVVLLVVFLMRNQFISSIELSDSKVTMEIDDTKTLSYTISPSFLSGASVKYSSSDKSVATVSEEGKVVAIENGKCVITVTTPNGKTADCQITVEKAKPNLKSIYNQYCKSTYASVSSDGSGLSIDTNPNDKDDYFDSDAYYAIKNVNKALGLPDSVLTKMGETTSLDGRQSYSGELIEVSWKYHPDNGLEVLYELK